MLPFHPTSLSTIAIKNSTHTKKSYKLNNFTYTASILTLKKFAHTVTKRVNLYGFHARVGVSLNS